MTKLEKLEYYTEKLSKELSDENVSEFLYDTSECVYPENDTFCPFCSDGCFKRHVFGALDTDVAKDVIHKMYYIRYKKNQGEF